MKKEKKKIQKNNILIFAFVFTILGSVFVFTLPYTKLISLEIFREIKWGWILTSINFYAGILPIIYALNKREKTFLIIVLGGMVMRLFLMLGIIIIFLQFLEFSQNAFIFTVFIFYNLYLFIEIIYLSIRK